MPIDPKTEKTFRNLLDHALHSRLDDVAKGITDAGPHGSEQATALAVQVAGYIMTDVCKGVPSETDLREGARVASESRANLPVTEDESYAFLARIVFGPDSGPEVFQGSENAPVIPLFTTAQLILSFTPKGTKMWDYLDVIENAIEAASQARADSLPAFVYRFARK